ncbi:unnamed protein product [Diatraea saccharalis]|uniref:Uncharacterized protein n=1 Tax=Diatraea saccharalis TaxID=40085 RepID=A0A9P0C4S1_9NEOP|nr:unnamed protein product [Diatraea saccharalis]
MFLYLLSGGLFNSRTSESSYQAFERISRLGGAKSYHGRALQSQVVDSYSTALDLCSFTSDGKGIAALIDSRPTEGICDTTCLISNRYNVAHLAIGWEPTDTLKDDIFTFMYYPPPDLISKAYATLIKDLEWDKFTILYEDDGSFIRLQEIINTWPQENPRILFRQLDPEGDNKEIFKHIFKVARISYHILDCDVNNVRKYMEEIVQVENATQYLSFILTNLDTYTINLEDVPDLMANVSTMHLTTTNTDRWRDLGMNPDVDTIQLETALVADALTHIEKAMKKMQGQDENERKFTIVEDFTEPPGLCLKDSKADYEEAAWALGQNLREILINTTARGFTGNIEFDEDGRRKNFMLHYSKLGHDSQFIYVGDWDSTKDSITKENTVTDRSMTLKSNKIRVATRVGSPYFVFTQENDTSPYPYRGYAVDLISEIFKLINKEEKVNLEFEFYRVDHDQYGNQIAGTNKWNGMMGDLIEHKADLGICDITITSERNSVVDFSTPFMTLGISMLFREPDPEPPDMFSFLLPLDLDVWLYLATTYIIVSFVLLICARMSQDDWVNPHPCNQNPENLQNIWSLYNCMWLAMGTIMTQGCDILPRAAGSRWVAGMWWFFALIVTASYMANMSTFLSNSRRSSDINDVKALSQQNKVAYGAVYNASTYRFFQKSNESVYQKIWSVMSSAKPTVFVNNNEEGKDRVLRSKGKYAFFMESTAIEYYTHRNCELKMVGGNLDSKEYGIAMPKHYPFKPWIDHAILSLQESGRLTELKKKWWEDEDNTEHCQPDDQGDEEDNGSLQMKNTSGIFLVLGIGGILGLLVAILDFLLHARQISVKERITFKEALLSEWHASLDPRVLHKPVAPPRSISSSSGTPSLPDRERSRSRAASVLRAASSFINFDEIY